MVGGASGRSTETRLAIRPMKLLLDTHTALWWWSDPQRLPKRTISLLSNVSIPIFVSSATAYELAYKHYLGKLHLPEGLLQEFEKVVRAEFWNPLDISVAHSLLAGRLASPHRDPFDRLLAAQTIAEEATLVTLDPAFASFEGLKTLWDRF